MMSKEDILLLQKILGFLEMAIATVEANGDKTFRVVSAKTNRVMRFYGSGIHYKLMFNDLGTVLDNLFKAQVFVPSIKLPVDGLARVDSGEYAVVKNPFYMLTKEEAAIKVDLESWT